VEAYVGQHLSTWRAGTDYRSSYSARSAEGGGVLRDLSHELDLLTWLLGGWERLTALGGHLSRLEIDSDDVWTILWSTRRCPVVSVQLNYLDRPGRRRLLAHTDDHTVEADLVNGRLTIDGAVESIATDRDLTYTEQHRAVLSGRTDGLCTLEEGMEVLRMIAAVERAAREKAWVAR
jgi:predicted dehydrogenase